MNIGLGVDAKAFPGSRRESFTGRLTRYLHRSASEVSPWHISYQIRPSVLSVRNSAT